MNIKISIRDCDSNPTVSNYKEVSEVQHKKKNMLYAPPQRDVQSNNKKTVCNPKQNKKASINTNSEQYRQSEKQMLNQLKKNGKNHATLDMVQNSNAILQRQNQILEQNQKTINGMANQNRKKSQAPREELAKSDIKEALDQIKLQVSEIQKIRNQIVGVANDFNKNINDFKNRKGQPCPQIPQMNQMNSNLKDLVAVSQNHLEGLQNLQGIKQLQNFNMEGYMQSINTLKRQISQYQKESQSIERQLKIRSAKLEKLDISPKFEDQLYKPYQQHLSNRANSIDLHSIRDKIYEKIGVFDYGAFQYDIGQIMAHAKGELNNFSLTCKQYEIQVPEIKLDMKELKKLELRAPSVLDEYKAARGIVFEDKKENTQKVANETRNQEQIRESRHKKTDILQQRLRKMQGLSKKPANLEGIQSKPIDTSKNVRLTRECDRKPQTILGNQHQKQKKQLQERVRITSQQKKKQDSDFQKYLESRAKQQLELIYKERNERLKRMQDELKQTCNQPMTFIQLDLNKKQINKKQNNNSPSPKKHQKKSEIEDEYEDEFQEEQNDNNNKKQNMKKNSDAKQIGRDILKQKLRNILSKKEQRPEERMKNNRDGDRDSKRQAQRSLNFDDPNRHVQNMAEGFVNMINNTLTQVNANLANVIQKKVVSTSQQKRRDGNSLERKQAKRIQIPKLEQFRAPPVFNMNMNLVQPSQPIMQYKPYPVQPKPKTKIIVEDYHNLKPEDSYSDLNISELEDD